MNPFFFLIRAVFPIKKKKFSSEVWFAKNGLNRYGPSSFASKRSWSKSQKTEEGRGCFWGQFEGSRKFRENAKKISGQIVPNRELL